MFKIFVLCTVLVTISGGPTDQQNVDRVAVVVENEALPEEFAVPIELLLKARLSDSKDVPACASQARIDPEVERQRIKDVLRDVIEEVNDENNNRFLVWLIKQKFTTTTTTTTMPPTTMPTTMAAPVTMMMMPAMMMPAMMM